ncbi:hypothetical protein FGB62_14g035 [Gracilaria domingensis]|nr:hypothetical protein FGB62_14g035 [Gracilaria domingensis]
MALDSSKSSGTAPQWIQLVRALRKGKLGAIDYFLEAEKDDDEIEQLPGFGLLLGSLLDSWNAAILLVKFLGRDERAQSELREMLSWCSAKEVWSRAYSTDKSFGTAAISACLGFCADIVALGFANENDLQCIEKLSHNIMQAQDFNEGIMTRPVLHMLRMSFTLREQYALDCEGGRVAAMQCPPSSLRNCAKGLLGLACDVLIKCQTSDDRPTGVLAKQTALEDFMCTAMLGMQQEGDALDFQQVFAKHFLSAFEDSDKAEGNLFASMLCNMVSSLVTSSPESGPTNAFMLYSGIVAGMRYGAMGAPSDKAVASFSCFLANSIFQFYTDSEDENKEPSPGAREFFAKMRDTLRRQFPESMEATEDSQDVLEELEEVSKTLVALQNLTEQDVQQESSMDEVGLRLDFDNVDADG